MRPPRPISLQGTLCLNSVFLVLAIPGAVVWLSSESLVALVAMLPAAGVSLWSQIDLRRTLGVPLWPLWGTQSQLLDALRGRDTFYPNDPLQSAPEKPTE